MSNNCGTLITGADDNVISVISGVELANNKENQLAAEGMNAVAPFVRTVFGINGHTEAFKDFNLFATDDGQFGDAQTYNEEYKSWTYNRKG